MFRTMLKSKLHRCRVTQANLYYKGSITIDSKLLAAADILEYEKVEVLNLNNGQRIETYAIKGKPGSGVVCLNGPAARGACVGDEVIVVSYAQMDEARAKTCVPRIIHVNERNRIKN